MGEGVWATAPCAVCGQRGAVTQAVGPTLDGPPPLGDCGLAVQRPQSEGADLERTELQLDLTLRQ
ncbi:hypothetical protein GCM10009738_10160 [Kitasatospora viridis]